MYLEAYRGGEPQTADEVFRRAAAVKLRLYGAPKVRNVRKDQIRQQARLRAKDEIRRELIEGAHRAKASALALECREIKGELARARIDAEAFEALVAAGDPADQPEGMPPVRPRPSGRIFVEDIVRQGCLFFNMRRDVLFSNRRDRAAVMPRQVVTWAAAEFCPHLSLPMIGRQTGGRDHTTILHSKRKVEEWIEKGDPMGVAALRFAECLRAVFPQSTNGEK